MRDPVLRCKSPFLARFCWSVTFKLNSRVVVLVICTDNKVTSVKPATSTSNMPRCHELSVTTLWRCYCRSADVQRQLASTTGSPIFPLISLALCPAPPTTRFVITLTRLLAFAFSHPLRFVKSKLPWQEQNLYEMLPAEGTMLLLVHCPPHVITISEQTAAGTKWVYYNESNTCPLLLIR